MKLFYFFTRLFYYPLINWILPNLSPKIRKRVEFEKGNIQAPFKSFHRDNVVADFAFEVSSEGELEQIRPLLDQVLKNGQRVELIYCSESVDHKCMQLYLDYPEQLRIFRMPLLTFNPFVREFNPGKWLTAKKFFLCRYDFFPELVFYGKKSEVEFILLWATLKNSEKAWPQSWYQNYVYASFDKIVCATNSDKQQFIDRFHTNLDKIEVYDFRPWQIINRQHGKEAVLQQKFPQFSLFEKFVNEIPKEKRILFGSFWDYEIDAFNASTFKKFIQQHLVAIVCHKLDSDYLKHVQMGLEQKSQTPVYVIDESIDPVKMQGLFENYHQNPGIIMINLKGVLCELYSLFGHAFVGGGHGISVHSLMEPFLAGALVYCGPKVHRSTEYDLIRESHPDRLHIIENIQNFFPFITGHESIKYKDMHSFKGHYEGHFGPVLNWLGIKAQWS
jgi:3-deoxy-D-manno-octulosonic-acid transferase